MFAGEMLFRPNIGSDGIQRGSIGYDIVPHIFNQDISSWDVSNVRNMHYMFSYNSKFNQDISSWDVSNVRYMNTMFQGYESFGVIASFNQPIVTGMFQKFLGWAYFKILNLTGYFKLGCI